MERKDSKPAPLRMVAKARRASNEVVTLRGRMFAVLPDCTIEGRPHWARCLRKGGLATLAPFEDETAEQFASRVRGRVIESGVAYRLMAARLAPRQDSWSAEKAGLTAYCPDETTVEFLSRLTEPDDLAAVEQLLQRIVRAIVAEAVTP
jgi:hypothetical protein